MSNDLWMAYSEALKAWQDNPSEANAWRTVNAYRAWVTSARDVSDTDAHDLITGLVKNLAEKTRRSAA